MSHHRALAYCSSMISAQTLRVCREEKPVSTFPDRALAFHISAMRDLLCRDALDRTFLGAHGGSRERLHHFPGAFRIGDPLRIELVGTGRDAAIAVARVDHAGVAAMDQLEEMVLRLAGRARVADQRLGELGVLDAVILLAAFAERAAVEADDGGMTEVGVDAVEAGGVRDRHIHCWPR